MCRWMFSHAKKQTVVIEATTQQNRKHSVNQHCVRYALKFMSPLKNIYLKMAHDIFMNKRLSKNLFGHSCQLSMLQSWYILRAHQRFKLWHHWQETFSSIFFLTASELIRDVDNLFPYLRFQHTISENPQ
ncbi:hypothetical protein CDL12_02318 [Handroanthus impetiginosus]|uniref:Uncharacterized protein n=1 Tax=Handroanthus impetiginosus TaxID=429701 RepID=A0A2G9I5N6_9LAMI|nr:hypothetical protein CDL12_02318 [Handroanthus impetiginosus]